MPTLKSNYYVYSLHKYKRKHTHTHILHASKCEKLCMRMYKYKIYFCLAIFLLLLFAVFFSISLSFFTISSFFGSFHFFCSLSLSLRYANCFFFTRAQSLSFIQYICMCMFMRAFCTYTFSPCRFATSHVENMG